jgi:predicted Holliday junction resolvase-like endonuclease
MSLLGEFQDLHKILCVCPKCGYICRVSDLKLKIKGKSEKIEKTWLDKYETKIDNLYKKETKFEEMKSQLREISREKGRKEAKKIFNKAISPTFKDLKYDPSDIIPILTPVDFVVFKDMTAKETVNDITFLSQKIDNKNINGLRDQVRKAVDKELYDWQVARIDSNGSITME